MINRLIIALMWAVVALALILGVNCYAQTSQLPAMVACNDLMAKIRTREGIAPLCTYIPQATEYRGVVGLAVPGWTPFLTMEFDPYGPDGYQYSEEIYNDLLAAIRYQHKGVTAEEFRKINHGN